MKRSWWLLVGLGLGALGACGKASTGDQVGGETHWLRYCDETSAGGDCGSELECVCGVCTAPCEADAACGVFSDRAQCARASQTEYASSCGAAVPERICVRAPMEAPGPVDYQIEGMRYDESRDCLRPAAFAGIQRTDGTPLACDDAITYAFGNGDCWRFSSSCIPDGFTEINLALVDARCVTADECPEPSCGLGQVGTIDGCLSCDDARVAMVRAVTNFVQDAGYGACSFDAECALSSWANACWAGCSEAMAATSVSSFTAGLSEATSGYCADSEAWTTTCGGVPDLNCARVTPICRAGTCVASDQPPCFERPLETCEADGDCALARAYPFDAQRQCFAAESVVVGCIDPDANCPPITTPGVDLEGSCFLFGNCLAAGFTRAPDEHACTLASGNTCAD